MPGTPLNVISNVSKSNSKLKRKPLIFVQETEDTSTTNKSLTSTENVKIITLDPEIDYSTQEVNSLNGEISNNNNNDNNDNNIILNNNNDNNVSYSEPSVPLYPKSQIEKNWKIVYLNPPGLINVGVTCYLNSALQALMHVPALTQYFLNNYRPKHSSSKDDTSSTLGLFHSLVKQAFITNDNNNNNNNSNRKIKHRKGIYPSGFIKNLKKIASFFTLHRQEDAHEFLIALLDSMQNSLVEKSLPESLKETSVLHRIFGGRILQRIICEKCKKSSDTFQATLDLSVELSKKITTLELGLKKFFSGEILSIKEGNAYKCDNCKEYVNATKTLALISPPQYLIIHLKRFVYTTFGTCQKVQNDVSFSESINLDPYILFNNENKNLSTNYSLISTINHQGRKTSSGHYTTFCKQPNGTWSFYDDESTEQVSINSVLKEQAYILIYSLNDSKSTSSTGLKTQSPKISKTNNQSSINDALKQYTSKNSFSKDNINESLILNQSSPKLKIDNSINDDFKGKKLNRKRSFNNLKDVELKQERKEQMKKKIKQTSKRNHHDEPIESSLEESSLEESTHEDNDSFISNSSNSSFSHSKVTKQKHKNKEMKSPLQSPLANALTKKKKHHRMSLSSPYAIKSFDDRKTTNKNISNINNHNSKLKKYKNSKRKHNHHKNEDDKK